MTFGAFEFLIILFIVLLLIGPRRIADLGRSLGRGVRDFRLEFDKDKKAVGTRRSAIDESKNADTED